MRVFEKSWSRLDHGRSPRFRSGRPLQRRPDDLQRAARSNRISAQQGRPFLRNVSSTSQVGRSPTNPGIRRQTSALLHLSAESGQAAIGQLSSFRFKCQPKQEPRRRCTPFKLGQTLGHGSCSNRVQQRNQRGESKAWRRGEGFRTCSTVLDRAGRAPPGRLRASSGASWHLLEQTACLNRLDFSGRSSIAVLPRR